MKSDAATTIVMAGVTLYFIGCVELFTNWNSHHKIGINYLTEQYRCRVSQSEKIHFAPYATFLFLGAIFEPGSYRLLDF